jgi:hypothetical protein
MLADIDPVYPDREKAVNLLIAVGGATAEIEVHAVLDRLRICNRHEADAGRRVLVGSDDDLILPDRPSPTRTLLSRWRDQWYSAVTSIVPTMLAFKAGRSSAGIQYSRMVLPPTW